MCQEHGEEDGWDGGLQPALQCGTSLGLRVRMELWHSKERKGTPEGILLPYSRHRAELPHSTIPFVSLLLLSALMQRRIKPLGVC